MQHRTIVHFSGQEVKDTTTVLSALAVKIIWHFSSQVSDKGKAARAVIFCVCACDSNNFSPVWKQKQIWCHNNSAKWTEETNNTSNQNTQILFILKWEPILYSANNWSI